MKTLTEMLTYRRPAGSKTERRFIREFIKPLGVSVDKYGNCIKRIGTDPVMWSCHTDTVHRDGGQQAIQIANNWVTLPLKTTSNCLGADDTAGVWLMRELILANKPGLYVFHRAEECGGIGSKHIVNHSPELVEGIQYAIALDRMGHDSVITHQMHRCCSDTFATALALQLGGAFCPDSGGIFTDTANYTDLIPECTNLSVGYYNQHSTRERLDLQFIAELREKLIALDVSKLPVGRKVTDPDDYSWYDSDGAYGSPYGQHSSYQTVYFDAKVNAWSADNDQQDYRGRYDRKPMSDIISDHPKEVADILRQYGLSEADLIEELRAMGVTL